MKLYKLTQNLDAPAPLFTVGVPTDSEFGIAVKLMKDGEVIETATTDLTMIYGDTEIEAEDTKLSDYVVFVLTSNSDDKDDKVWRIAGTVAETIPVNLKVEINQKEEGVADVDANTVTPPYVLPVASADELGGVKIGENLTIDEDGVLSADSGEYELPIASAETLGGVKIGEGVTIAEDGVLSADVSEDDIPTKTSDLTNDSGFITEDDIPYGGENQIGVVGFEPNSGIEQSDFGEGYIKVQISQDPDNEIEIRPDGLFSYGRNFSEWKERSQNIAAGQDAIADAYWATAYGMNANAGGENSVAIGHAAIAEGTGAVQLGQGENLVDGSLQFGDYQVIDGDGNIPEERLGAISTAVLSGTYDDDTEFSFEVYVKSA